VTHLVDLPGLWSLSRATGLVLLVLLSVTLAFGMLATARTSPRWWPRFATAALHVDLAVLSLALLIAHVTVTVLDGWVDIGWADAVIPFRAGYRPVWTGLGTVAALLLVTAAATAGARRFLPLPLWRRTHYLTHAAWPVAVVHGLGAGSDRGSPGAVGLTLGCVALVTFATVLRFTGPPGSRGHGWGGVLARLVAVVLPVLLGAWLGSTGALR
jgi:sulfoxide reductase heme-binding subunit YedZ